MHRQPFFVQIADEEKHVSLLSFFFSLLLLPPPRLSRSSSGPDVEDGQGEDVESAELGTARVHAGAGAGTNSGCAERGCVTTVKHARTPHTK